jgi:PmbA protein
MGILETLASLADQAEVVSIRNESTKVSFEANRLKASQVEETKGVAVRVVKEGRLGFAATSDESAADRLVTNALESAAYGAQIPLAFPGPQPGPEVETFDRTVADLPIHRLVEIGQKIVDIILPVEPEARINIDLERAIQHLSLCNQAGGEISFQRSPLSIEALVSRVKGDDVLMTFDMAGSTIWDDDYLAFAHRIAEKLKLAQKSATIRSGRMPVLFAPTGALVLALPLTLGLNGKNVYTGISPIKGRGGDRLFSDRLSIIDDPTLDGRLGSAPFDDEGVAHRRNVLVDRGVLKGFVYDLKTAAQSGVESTGNGSRNLFDPPAPSPSNLLFVPGETPLSEMMASIDAGLLVQDVLGLGQGNIISGAFSNSLSLAFKIEKGEIVGRVKDVSIAGNVYDLLKDVAAVSRETEWVYGSLNLPHILLADMNVVAKQ